MSKGWREVARLGGSGARYPHLLADPHGWCLRLGPRSRGDDKYYSSLPVLLQGLVEQVTRRRLLSLSGALELRLLLGEVRDALKSALGLCEEALRKGGLEEHMRRLGTSRSVGRSKDTLPSGLSVRAGGYAAGDALPREAV
jgi:hypothetical protein